MWVGEKPNSNSSKLTKCQRKKKCRERDPLNAHCIVCDELFSCVRFKCNGINLYTSVHLYARLIGDMWYTRRIVLCFVSDAKAVAACFLYVLLRRFKSKKKNEPKSLLLRLLNCCQTETNVLAPPLSLSFSRSALVRSNCLFRKWTHTEINMLGKTFQIRSLVFFPCRRAHFSCISFACRTLFGCSFSFSSVPIQWNKLLRIVSCNPTIRLFVSLAALAIASCVLQYSSVSVYRLCIQYYSKCADAAGWLAGSRTACRKDLKLYFLLFKRQVRAQKSYRRIFFCRPCVRNASGIRTQNAIKSHLDTVCSMTIAFNSK